MAENFNDENWIHVDSYLRDDGTRVSEYWRRKYVNPAFANYELNSLSGGISYEETTFPPNPNIANLADLAKRKIQNGIDDFAVNYINKNRANFLGEIFSWRYKTDEANNLYKLASPDKNYNPEYVQKNGTLYSSTEELTDKKLGQKIKARLLLENTGMNDCKVFVANENSSLSQKIADSDELKNIIKDDIQYIRQFHVFPAQGKDIEFTSPDLYNAIHGANISDAKFDKDGNLYLSIEDLYNFNKGRTSVKGRIGEKFQNEGEVIPYYLKVNIKIPKSALDKY